MPETFPLNTDYGLRRKTYFKTLIKRLGGGNEQRVSKSTAAEHTFLLTFNERLCDPDMEDLYDFYVARKGAYEAFNITDPLDGTTRLVRFSEDGLTQEYFYFLLGRAQIEVVEVTS